MRKHIPLFLIILLSSSTLRAVSIADKTHGPWYTGPLLTPSPITAPPGHIDLEPYLFVNRFIGSYDSNWKSNSQDKSTSIVTQVLFDIGITNFMDFEAFPFFISTNKQGHTATRFADLPLQLNFQLLHEEAGSLIPSIKLILGERFPTGHYQKLNPKKLGADISGTGSYQTTFGIAMGQTYDVGAPHFLRFRLNFNYRIPTSVHVKGFNVYGGGYGANGRVNPGNEFSVLLGFEYTPTLHWAFALDVVGISISKAKFSGYPGTMNSTNQSSGVSSFPFASVGRHSSEQYSLAPAVEYNFAKDIGIIAGAWFTVLGRNADRFVNGVVALNMYF